MPINNISIIGHRGARSYAPENVIPGYEVALESGVDSIDVDVVTTSDKVLLAYHDLHINSDILSSSNTSEVIDNTILVKDLTLTELKNNYTVGLNPNSDYSKWFPNQKQIPNTRLNSLQEIVDFINLKTNNTIQIQIEIKNSFLHPEWSESPSELARLMYEFIQKNNLVNRIKVQAFDWRILVALNQFNPNIKTAYLFAYDTKDNYQKLFANSKVMDEANKMPKSELAFLPNLVKALGGYSYEPEDNELRYEDVVKVKKLGLKIFVWTWPEHSGFVYNPELIKKLISWEIDGVITDNPNELRELLKNKF
jgi:glycerophosphoryl diester phosphodiesterase